MFSKIRITPLILLGVFFFSSPLFAVEKMIYDDRRTYARANVIKVERIAGEEDNPYDVLVRIHLEILDGVKKGETPVVEFKGEDNMPKDMFYKAGDTVFIGIAKTGQDSELEYILLYDVDNTKGIIIFALLLVLVVILVGRFRSVLSMLSLIATIILLFYVLIPMTLKGHSPLPMATLISLVAIVITIPIILGFQKKPFAAICGAASGVLISTLLALFAGGYSG
jgi:uncharacterized membrane protein